MSARVSPALAVRLGAAALGVLLAMMLVDPAAAQQVPNGGVGSGVAGFGLGDWFGLMTRLALVVLVIWGAVYAMRWYVKRMNGGLSGRSHQMEILETHSLGPNRALHLIRLGERAVLIGATPERINSLMQIDSPEEVERLAERPTEPTRQPVGSSWPSMLRATLEGRWPALRGRLGPGEAPLLEAALAEAAAEMAASRPATTATPRPRFSLSDLMPASTPAVTASVTDDEIVASMTEESVDVAEEPAPPVEAQAPKPRRRSSLLAGFRRLPEAFRMPPRPAPRVQAERQRPAAGEEPEPVGAPASARTGRPGLFDRALAATRETPVVERHAQGEGTVAGGFSAALAAMEARDGARAAARPSRSAPAERPTSPREAAAERAGLAELARDPQSFSRMSREQQIAQVQRAILAARETVERSA